MTKTETAATESAGPDADELPQWDLSDLFSGPDSDEFAQSLESLERQAAAFVERYAGRISALSAEELLACVRHLEQIQKLIARIHAFAQLSYSLDTLDPQRGKFAGDCKDKIAVCTSPMAFLDVEINRLDGGRLESLLAKNNELSRFRPYFRRVRKFKPHLLSAELEQYSTEVSTASPSAIVRLFDETCAAMKFRVAGSDLTLPETLDRTMAPDRAVRRKAFKALSKQLDSRLPLFSLVMNTVAKEQTIDDRWRSFDTPQASRHLSNDVDGSVVDAMLAAVIQSYPRISHRYYRLKAGWLGLRRLQLWDRNAPLPMASAARIPWSEAQSIVLTSFGNFSPRVAEIAAQFFARNWIDAGVRPGKAPGAFAHPAATDVHPYVLLNYHGRPHDVMTLAHELGHGVHQTLAAGQGPLMAGTPLTLAETASVFGETLTFQRLLENSETEEERKVLLAGKVEDMINTMIRQTAFHVFESRVHENIREGGELTAPEICELWMSVQSESLGPAFSFTPDYRCHWAYVPHFIHAPFYVYSYAFGLGLALALYAAYESGIAQFIPKYLAMLAAGGSKHHSELLAPFDIAVTDPAFWNSGLAVISRYIDELEAMET